MFSQRTWIAFSGVTWFVLGVTLLSKGLRYLATLTDPNLAVTLMGVALLIGFFKGRFVLSKTVARVVGRITSQGKLLSWKEVYSPYYLALIALMMVLGITFKWLPLPIEFKGIIDTAVGSALIYGASAYFRSALRKKKILEDL